MCFHAPTPLPNKVIRWIGLTRQYWFIYGLPSTCPNILQTPALVHPVTLGQQVHYIFSIHTHIYNMPKKMYQALCYHLSLQRSPRSMLQLFPPARLCQNNHFWAPSRFDLRSRHVVEVSGGGSAGGSGPSSSPVGFIWYPCYCQCLCSAVSRPLSDSMWLLWTPLHMSNG